MVITPPEQFLVVARKQDEVSVMINGTFGLSLPYITNLGILTLVSIRPFQFGLNRLVILKHNVGMHNWTDHESVYSLLTHSALIF